MPARADADEWAGVDVSVRRGNDHDPSWFAGVASDARIRDREFDLVVVSSRTHLYLATRKCGRAET
jgi:hypothetical protein